MQKFNFQPMKKVAFASLAFAAALFLAAFTTQKNTHPAATELKWYTWDEAVELNKTKPKKMMVDVYTDWCGWCKTMDKKTFTDAGVAAYITENFYPVKLDAEQKADIVFNGETFKYVENGGRRGGVHTLAYSLLDGKMGYPSIVYLTEKYERILISPGYKEPDALMTELKFTASGAYLTQSWDDFKAAN